MFVPAHFGYPRWGITLRRHKGGVEPARGRDASASGKEARVPYTAEYYFYKRK